MRLYNGKIRSDFREVHFAVLDVVELLKLKCGIVEQSLLFSINFALRELLNNAVEHGNRFDDSKKVFITVDYDEPNLVFMVEDEGEGFEPAILNVLNEMNDELAERNRGIRTIREMDFDIRINRNQVWLKVDIERQRRRPNRHGEIITG